MDTITFISTRRTVATVAHFMKGTTVAAALALSLAGTETDEDEVSVKLDTASVLKIRRIMGQQPEGIVAKVNKELDELLFAQLMANSAEYGALLQALETEERSRTMTRDTIAASGVTASEELLAIINLNR